MFKHQLPSEISSTAFIKFAYSEDTPTIVIIKHLVMEQKLLFFFAVCYNGLAEYKLIQKLPALQ